MVGVVKILLVVLFLIRRVASAVEFGYYARLAEINVLGSLSAVDIVSAVRVERPHLVEVESLRALSILVGTLPVLPVDVGGGVVGIYARDELVTLVPCVGSAVSCGGRSVSAFVLVLEQAPAVVRGVHVLRLLRDFVVCDRLVSVVLEAAVLLDYHVAVLVVLVVTLSRADKAVRIVFIVDIIKAVVEVVADALLRAHRLRADL